MISPNMIAQGKQPEDFQPVKDQSSKESSKGIFGAILNALQTDVDDGGTNLLSKINSEESDSGSDGDGEGESENGAKTLLTLSALTTRLGEAEAEVEAEAETGDASEHIDENAEDSIKNLANEQEISDEREAGTVTEETGQSPKNSTDEPGQFKGEVSDEKVVEKNSDENSSVDKEKIVEGSDRIAATESKLNSVKMNAETEKSEVPVSELKSVKATTSQTENEVVDGKQNSTESTANTESEKTDSSLVQETGNVSSQSAGSASGINFEGINKGVENTVVSEEKIVTGSSKPLSDERTPLQGKGQPVQLNDTARNRGGEQLFSTENGEENGRITQAPEASQSSEKSQDSSVGQILQSGNAGVSEAGIAGAAVNSKSINIDRIREEKEKKMSARTFNAASSGDQTRSRDASENGSAKSLFPFSGGQDFGSLDITSDEDSVEESVLFWNRFGYEGSESVDDKKSNSLLLGLSRLSQIPIMNTTVRQQLLNGIAQSVQKLTGSGKTAETWQKHTFSLENGKNVQISVRQVEGVLHLKLGSTNSELTKLLQMNQQEIKDHLQNEFDIEVDLEFNQQDDGNSSEWFDAMQGQKSSNRGYPNSTAGVRGNATDGQQAGRTVRNFGYNQMEWTA